MTEHSICQPGLPNPQGESQAGSPGFEDFQRAKSEAVRLPEVVAAEEERDPSPSSNSSLFPLLQGASLAYVCFHSSLFDEPFSLA